MILNANIYVSTTITNINNLFVIELKKDTMCDIIWWEVVLSYCHISRPETDNTYKNHFKSIKLSIIEFDE